MMLENCRDLFLIMLTTLLLVACNNDDDLNSGVRTSTTALLFASSHTGDVKRFDINSGKKTTYNTASSDAEGVFYDAASDAITIVSRSSSQLQTYKDISGLRDGRNHDLQVAMASTSDLQSPRDLAVNGEFYVVSDNADVDNDETTPDGRFFIYRKTENGINLRNVVITRFKVWGIEFVGDDLYAVIDATGKLAVFKNFLGNNTFFNIASPGKIVEFEGIVRAYGLDYDNGTMLISDIGDEASDNDGALHVVTGFDSKFANASNNSVIPLSEQLRISGNKTLLGNPVNVVYDAAYNTAFVAELANGGGRVLAFRDLRTASGNIAPTINYSFTGASSIDFYTE